MLPDKKLKTLQLQVHRQKELLKRASATIIEQNVSDYPIFVFHEEGIDIGIPIFIPEEGSKEWLINATTLEELSTKSLVMSDKVEDFKKAFKDPEQFFCLFVVIGGGGSYIFLPQNKV